MRFGSYTDTVYRNFTLTMALMQFFVLPEMQSVRQAAIIKAQLS